MSLPQESSPPPSTLPFPTLPAGPCEVGFLFVGGQHQMAHIAPVAAALAGVSGGRCRARLLVVDPDDAEPLDGLMRALGSGLRAEVTPQPAVVRAALRAGVSPARLKLPRLLAARGTVARLAALVVSERTSTILKQLPGRLPPFVHIPHGAGDRAKGFERRIRLFDHVIVSGPKDRQRMVAAGLVPPDRCTVSGSIKLEAMLATRPATPEPLFADRRPVLLYNPHFARPLNSWQRFARPLVEAVLADGSWNLVIAPHVRLRERLPVADLAWLEGLGDRVLVDLGSARSADMTYTLAADLYVGDVSSQVYEYLHRPRPCVFLNATGRDRAGDPDFAFWRFGEVVDTADGIGSALRRAALRHAGYRAQQQQGVAAALGPWSGAAARAAATVAASCADEPGSAGRGRPPAQA